MSALRLLDNIIPFALYYRTENVDLLGLMNSAAKLGIDPCGIWLCVNDRPPRGLFFPFCSPRFLIKLPSTKKRALFIPRLLDYLKDPKLWELWYMEYFIMDNAGLVSSTVWEGLT